MEERGQPSNLRPPKHEAGMQTTIPRCSSCRNFRYCGLLWRDTCKDAKYRGVYLAARRTSRGKFQKVKVKLSLCLT